MAQRVHVVLVDDIDGSDAEETVTFGLDGSTYEIDLNAAHASQLREALAAYVGHARRVSGRRTSRRSSAPARSGSPSGSGSGPSAAEIRGWARENGLEVPERGRVSAEVRQAYDAAH
ncbi:histone-like nucleoid-structuring protein Lsr2 [Nocardioides donggukensis]|uniref:Lsr2 family protein n=1 Tax=Nocardioides donggukensis TaxID=2774019 RepID=A0A927Q247_9ACTN|nr:Lsr2 family protein [Nocardioides donggukensis]MBD8870857.1 Lsr2 family protein [Nocardioides donggukensis]